MKKIICFLLVCVLSVFLFCGCSDIVVTTPVVDGVQSLPEEIKGSVSGEIVAKIMLSSDVKVFYYRDNVTDVMYMILDDYRAGGLTIMFHPDGTPLLYQEFLGLVNGINGSVCENG